MKSGLNFAAAIFAVILVALGASIFTVDQRQHAIVFQLGEVREVIAEPGLYFKWPMIQNVRYFDKRILTLDNAEPERFITSEKKNVLVDSFVKWEDRRSSPVLRFGRRRRGACQDAAVADGQCRPARGIRQAHRA